jgi:hypothetical protein
MFEFTMGHVARAVITGDRRLSCRYETNESFDAHQLRSGRRPRPTEPVMKSRRNHHRADRSQLADLVCAPWAAHLWLRRQSGLIECLRDVKNGATAIAYRDLIGEEGCLTIKSPHAQFCAPLREQPDTNR